MINQILQFTQNHWIICLALVTILALLVFEEVKGKITGIPKISPRDATILLNRENAIVVDLRSQKTFSNGHILGAINIVRIDIDSHLKKLEAYKDKTVILVDDHDTHALPIATKLRTSGFAKACVLAGGLPSWIDAQLPLSKH